MVQWTEMKYCLIHCLKLTLVGIKTCLLGLEIRCACLSFGVQPFSSQFSSGVCLPFILAGLVIDAVYLNLVGIWPFWLFTEGCVVNQ